VAFTQFGNFLFKKVILSLELLYLHEVASVFIDGVFRIVEAVLELRIEGVEEREDGCFRAIQSIDKMVFHHDKSL
jgi:hypothetical protein